VLGGWEAMDNTGMGAFPEIRSREDPLEQLVNELRLPLDALGISAQWLLEHLRAEHGDPTDISATETLLQSVERMNRLVQALLEANRSQGF
jgi:hypothetical protein